MEKGRKNQGLVLYIELNSERDQRVKQRLVELASERRQSVAQLALGILEKYLENLDRNS
jgi:hypothetical protein